MLVLLWTSLGPALLQGTWGPAGEGYRRWFSEPREAWGGAVPNIPVRWRRTQAQEETTKLISERKSGTFPRNPREGRACSFLPSIDISELGQNVKARNLAIGQMLHLISMHSTNRSYESQLPSDREHPPVLKAPDVPFLRTKDMSSVPQMDLIR